MKNNDPIFFPGSQADLEFKQKRNSWYNDSINILQTQWYQFDLNQRFVNGDQEIWGAMFPGMVGSRSKTWNFNISNSAIQTMSGNQIRNRKSSTAIPVYNSNQKTADQISKALYHTLNHNGVYQKYSTTWRDGALVQGLGFLITYLDYTDDPLSGDIKKRYIDPKSCMYDPFFRQHDLSDMRFFETRQFFDREEAALLYYDYYDEIMSLPKGGYRDDRYYYMPEVYQIQQQNLIALDECWYLSSREATYIIDKETEECQEWRGDDEQLRDLMRDVDPVSGKPFRKLLAVQKRFKPTVNRALIINDRVMVDESNPYKMDRYPISVCLGYFTGDTSYYNLKFRGVTNDMRDPQYLMNRLQVNCLDQVESQQSGIKMEKGALVTPDDSLNKGNGRVLVTQPGMFEKVDKLHIDPPSPVLLEMVSGLKALAEYISGVSPEMMGMELDDKAGIISMVRQLAATTRIAPLLDNFDEFQRIDGDITIEMMQNCYTYGKIAQIIGEEPTQEWKDKLFMKYKCKVAPGVLTETQQQLEAHQLMYVRKELDVPISGKRILQTLTLQNKDEILKEVEAAEQAQQQASQQRGQLEMQQLQVDNATKMSYANSQNSLAEERKAKVQVDIAEGYERIKRGKEEEMGSILNLVKALKELEGVDLDNLAKKLELLHGIDPAKDEKETAREAI